MYNEMVPTKSDRLIQNLRTEVSSLRIESSSLREQLQTRDVEMDDLKIRMNEMKDIIQREEDMKERKLLLDSITVQPPGAGSYSNGRISCLANGTNIFATSSFALPKDKVSTWNVYLCMQSDEVEIGVSRYAQIKRTIHRSNICSWVHCDKICRGDLSLRGSGGWPGWTDGDTARLTYDPKRSLLTLHLDRTNEDYSIAVNFSECYIYFAFDGHGNHIAIW